MRKLFSLVVIFFLIISNISPILSFAQIDNVTVSATSQSLSIPLNMGWNKQGTSNPWESPTDYSCLDTDINVIDGSFNIANTWIIVPGTNVRYIKNIIMPDGSNYLTTGSERVAVSDPENLDFIADNLNTSYSNPYSEWEKLDLAEGVYQTRIIAFSDTNLNGKYDREETVSNWSNTCQIAADYTAPVVTINEPQDEAVVQGVVEIKASLQDAYPDHYYMVIRNLAGQVVAGPGTVNDTNEMENKTIFTWNTNLVPDGEYTIHLAARDKAGNRDDKMGSLDQVRVFVKNESPKTPHFTRILDQENEVELYCSATTRSQMLNFEWSLNDETDIAGYWFGTNGNPYETYLTHPQNFVDITLNIEELEHYYTIIAVDTDGNESPISPSCYLNYDPEPPTAEFYDISWEEIVKSPEDLLTPIEYGQMTMITEDMEITSCEFEPAVYPLYGGQSLKVLCEFVDPVGYTGTGEFMINIVNVPVEAILLESTNEFSVNVTNGNPKYSYTWAGGCTQTANPAIASKPTLEGTYVCSVTIVDEDYDTLTLFSNQFVIEADDDEPETPIINDPAGDTTTNTGSINTNNTKYIAPLDENIVLGAEAEVLGEDTTVDEKIEKCEESEEKQLSGYVYLDKNGNDKWDQDDKGLSDITIRVYLKHEDERVYMSNIRTDENGYWQGPVCPGKYEIEIDEESIKEYEVEDLAKILSIEIENDDISNLNFELEEKEKTNYALICGLPILFATAGVALWYFFSKKGKK